MAEAVGVRQVRKPYTITKQRERWSEEEHNKFLEALQLHGRAWRLIEEHIGTKTAVQIRSHAQKFFSKVTRDANGNGTYDMKPIEIPPPRPKKKPTHPYPRKQVLSSSKGTPFLGRLKRSSSPVLSISEPENKSPTSVLSAVGSEYIDPFFSNNPNGGLTTENESSMELDMSSSVEHIHSKEARSRDSIAVPTLKLFGTTVVVADSCKQFSARSGDAPHRSVQEETISESKCNGSELEAGKPTEHLINGTWPGGFLPTIYSWPPILEAEASVVPLQWWPFHGNIPFLPYASREDLLQFNLQNLQNLQNECSGTGSNSAYEGANYAVESLPRKMEIGAAVGSDRKCSRGFVPYRKCALEEKVKRPHIAKV